MGDMTRSVAASSAPNRTRLSERWYGKVGVQLVGYDRLVRWYLAGKQKYARVRSVLDGSSRQELKRRRRLIRELSSEQQVQLKSADGTSKTETSHGSASSSLRRHGDFKIAVFCHCFHTGRGGAEKVAGRVAATLSRAGNTVHLYCRDPGTDRPAYEAEGDVEVRYLYERDDAQISALRSENYDLIIGFAMRGFYLRIAAISRLLSVPFVIQECNNPSYIALNLLDAHLCRDDEEAYWLRQAVCAQAAGVRLTVPHYAESVERDVEPFTYAFYNSFPTPPLVSSTPEKKFICVGAMKNANKNGPVAIEAFCEFASFNPGWSLHLYGDNKYQSQMDEILKRYPKATVVDHGIVRDLDRIYGDAYALLIPSFHEGLPNVVIEAFSYGVPCIGFADCPGTNQLIENESNGYLLDRQVSNSLTDAVSRISDPAKRHKFSVNARCFAEENLRLEQWESNWLRLVENAANGLNRRGEPQRPSGKGNCPRASQWDRLLITYLHFGQYADGRQASFENPGKGLRS